MIAVALNGSETRTLKNNTTGAELSVIASRGMVFSSWRFSSEELAAVAAGKPVWVVIRGEAVPEFHLAVGNRNEVVPPDIIKRAKQTDAILKTPLGEQVISAKRRESWIVEALAWGYLGASLLAIAAIVNIIYGVLFGR